jgi:hypothetical protein
MIVSLSMALIYPARPSKHPGGFWRALGVEEGTSAGVAVDALLALGIVATLPTAAAGLADWSDTYGSDSPTGPTPTDQNSASASFTPCPT